MDKNTETYFSSDSNEDEEIEICFLCKKPVDEEYRNNELPEELKKKSKLRYHPCEKCFEELGNRIFVIGIVPEPCYEGQPSILKLMNDKGKWEYYYPTGNYMRATKPDFVKMCGHGNNKEYLKRAFKDRMAFIHDSTLRDIIRLINNEPR